MKIISSGRTWFYKKLFPLIMFGAMGLFIAIIIATSGKPNGPPLPLIIFPLAMMGFFYFIIKNLVFDLADEVQDCDTFLMVKFKNEEEQIFLTNIMNVSYSYMVNPPRVTLLLRQPCRFGKEIVFCPVITSGFVSFLRLRNTVIDDLIERIDAARKK